MRSLASTVEVTFVQLRQENMHLKERIQDLVKQVEFLQNANVDSKERRRIESREEQARRELQHVKREKEKLVDQNSQMALALKQANDELKQARQQIELLKEKIHFYEKTFPRKQ